MMDQLTRRNLGINNAEVCPQCRRVGFYWLLSNDRRQCRAENCLTMWKKGEGAKRAVV